VLQIGAPSEVYETPATRFVADFIGNVNLIDGTLVTDEPDHCIIDCGDVRHFVGHGITGTAGMKVSVAVRPEKIHLSRHAPAHEADHDAQGGADFNRAKGVVKNLAYFGSFTVYHLELEGGRVLKVSQNNTQRYRNDDLTWGDVAWAHWSRQSQVVMTL